MIFLAWIFSATVKHGCTGTKFVLILYYRSQRFHVNFDVKKVLVCRLSIGLYFSKSKFDLFFFRL